MEVLQALQHPADPPSSLLRMPLDPPGVPWRSIRSFM
jgi:hypothetical protein